MLGGRVWAVSWECSQSIIQQRDWLEKVQKTPVRASFSQPAARFHFIELTVQQAPAITQVNGRVWSSVSSHSTKSLKSKEDWTHRSHLSHEAVCVGVLLILEDNVWVVVAHKFIEALGVARDLALCSAAGSEVVFWEVGGKLLVVHGRELPGPDAGAVPRARSASLDQPYAGPHSKQAELCQAGPPGLLHWGGLGLPGVSGSQCLQWYPGSRCVIAREWGSNLGPFQIMWYWSWDWYDQKKLTNYWEVVIIFSLLMRKRAQQYKIFALWLWVYFWWLLWPKGWSPMNDLTGWNLKF